MLIYPRLHFKTLHNKVHKILHKHQLSLQSARNENFLVLQHGKLEAEELEQAETSQSSRRETNHTSLQAVVPGGRQPIKPSFSAFYQPLNSGIYPHS